MTKKTWAQDLRLYNKYNKCIKYKKFMCVCLGNRCTKKCFMTKVDPNKQHYTKNDQFVPTINKDLNA